MIDTYRLQTCCDVDTMVRFAFIFAVTVTVTITALSHEFALTEQCHKRTDNGFCVRTVAPAYAEQSKPLGCKVERAALKKLEKVVDGERGGRERAEAKFATEHELYRSCKQDLIRIHSEKEKCVWDAYVYKVQVDVQKFAERLYKDVELLVANHGPMVSLSLAVCAVGLGTVSWVFYPILAVPAAMIGMSKLLSSATAVLAFIGTVVIVVVLLVVAIYKSGVISAMLPAAPAGPAVAVAPASPVSDVAEAGPSYEAIAPSVAAATASVVSDLAKAEPTSTFTEPELVALMKDKGLEPKGNRKTITIEDILRKLKEATTDADFEVARGLKPKSKLVTFALGKLPNIQSS